MTDSRPVLEQYYELLGILGRFTQHKMNMDEAIQVSCVIDKLPPSWKDFKVQDSDKPKSNNVAGPSVVNMVEHNNSSKYNDNKGKRKSYDNTRADPNKKAKPTCWKCGKTGHIKSDCKGVNVGNKAMDQEQRDDDVHVCKDRSWFKTYESLNDGSILHMGNESTSMVHRRACIDLRLGHVHFKRMQDMSKDGLIPAFDMDTGKWNKKYFVTFIDDALRFWTDRGGEYMDTLYFQTESRVLGVVVRLLDLKLKTLGESGIECIFVGYAKHSKAFRFYVIEPNDSISFNSINESRIAIFDENRFSSVPRQNLRIPNETKDIGGSVVPKEVTKEVVQQLEHELRKSKRNRTPKNFGPEFQLYLIEGTRDEVSNQHSYCFNVEDDPKTFDEAMKSRDVAFWKEAINVEMDSIMGNNTWCWLIYLQYHKTADCYDINSQSDYLSDGCETAFLNDDLDEEVYMNQPQGFIIPGNENKLCKLIKSLYGLKQAPKQWHQKFDKVVLSIGYLLNQANKCLYSKFYESGKGVVICLYVDDMLIFGTNKVQVNLTKEFLSSKFSMKDMGEADVILGIRIKHGSNGIAISQSHYIEKVLKKFNYFDCTPVSTPMDTSEKLMPNNGQAVSQLEYSRVIGCLMYAMTCTRPNITFVVGKLSRYTSNPGTQHWQAIQRVLKYLKKTMDYRLTYTGYPLVLEGYIDASWISNTKDNSSTSGWVFLLALAAAGKEVEWLRNLILEIPLWSKPIAPISIRCDSAATLAKAYSQMYNGKSRHLGVRHSMIRKLITNGVISIEFVWSQQNLVDHLMKGLARDLVIKSAEGMGLNGLKHMYLHIIPRMFLEPADKEDEVVNLLMINFFEKVLSRSMNKEEPPMYSNGLKGSILRTP
ncbi:zinc finger, CCHC-type containing protein [Tanacetum coccineum]